MNVIIVSGGKGTRVRPLTNEIPKTMIEVYGKSVLERQIEVFQSCGISDITAVTGYHSEQINFPNINCILAGITIVILHLLQHLPLLTGWGLCPIQSCISSLHILHSIYFSL